MATSSPALDQEPAVAGGIGRPKAQHRDRGALRERPPNRSSVSAGSAACRRRSPGDRRARAMAPRRPAPHARCRAARIARRSRRPARRAWPRRRRHRWSARSPPRSPCRPPADRIEHMGKQRSPADLVQHLRPRRVHARALAGRKDDRKAGAFTHQWLASEASSVGAVISECAAAEKAE